MKGTRLRGKRSAAAQQEAPPRNEHWIAEFKRQATDAMRQRAIRSARRCVQMIEWSGGQVPSSYAEDLVDDAIGDTWRGVLTWRPTPERSLLKHINSVVRSRARHTRKKAEKFPTASLDAHVEEEGDDNGNGAALWTEAEEALAARAPATIASDMLIAFEMFDALRALATGDLEVLALLDAMRVGAVDRADLMHATGMTARRYESARRRLDTLLQELPTTLALRIAAARASASGLHAA
jgi:hypothetical protein